MTEETRSSASATAPFGESTKRDCTDSHRFEKRSCSMESRSRRLSFSTRFSRSANFASAFRSDPCASTARSYSGPNFCRRSAVVLLRFRTYTQTSATMIRITTAASTISFGSSRFRFIETSTKPGLVHEVLFVVRTLVIVSIKLQAWESWSELIVFMNQRLWQLETRGEGVQRESRRPGWTQFLTK